MVSTDEELVSERESRRQTIQLNGAMRVTEDHHRDSGPGIERELFEAYIDTMTFRYEGFASTLDGNLVDEEPGKGATTSTNSPGTE